MGILFSIPFSFKICIVVTVRLAFDRIPCALQWSFINSKQETLKSISLNVILHFDKLLSLLRVCVCTSRHAQNHVSHGRTEFHYRVSRHYLGRVIHILLHCSRWKKYNYHEKTTPKKKTKQKLLKESHYHNIT